MPSIYLFLVLFKRYLDISGRKARIRNAKHRDSLLSGPRGSRELFWPSSLRISPIDNIQHLKGRQCLQNTIPYQYAIGHQWYIEIRTFTALSVSLHR